MTTAYFNLASGNYFQDWSNAGQLTTNDDWSGVPSIVGYRGDGLTGLTGADPRTITGTSDVIDVNVNQTNPNTFSTGGVTEFAIADPTIALTGSGTADVPYFVLHLDATGRQDLHLSLDVRDIDGSADDTNQQFNIQYRIGDTGTWVNLDGAYIADASAPGATLVTHLDLTLPEALNGQGQIQLRFMTTNAPSNDEWIGVDNISVTSQPQTGSTVAISGQSIVEGDDGTKLLTFTVTRGGAAADFSIDYATGGGTASAGGDYVANTGTLTFTAGGPASQTVSVVINGDTTPEPDETFSVSLSNLQVTSGSVVVTTATATGTIQNDDFLNLKIYQIQGAGHLSPYAGSHVVTEGIVTAIDTTGARGFWIQDPTGDGDNATSDAVFVYTGSVPTVVVGQTVRVEGDVNEFEGSDPNNLPITEIDSPIVTVLNGGALSALPAAVVLGAGGRPAPTQVIDDDNNTTFDPATDGLDFYETLEGMRVTIPDATAVATSDGNSTWVVADGGAGATGMNGRGGVTIDADDFNPERVQIFYDSGVAGAGAKPDAVTGGDLGDVTGIMHYFGGNYELLPTSIGATGAGGALPRETTTLDGDANHVTIAAYNVENLDPTDPQAKFDRLGQDIAQHLGGPDIIGLEEIQDADGAGTGGNLSGQATADKLIAAIKAAGGPTYVYVEVIPTGPVGGEAGGNIRQGYLYNPERVQYVAGSAYLLDDNDPANGDAYANSRKPLVAEFTFNGETITVVDVHNTSRIGSEELFGDHQPPDNAGEARRIDQTAPIKDLVEGMVAADPSAKVVVMGDFNAFQFETSLTQLTSGGAMTNLSDLLAPAERYTYVFDGNSQQIDHLLASNDLANGAQFDIVHMNAGQPASSGRATDHDAVVARMYVNAKPVAVADVATVSENQNVTIDVLANDTDANTGDTKTLISVTGGALGGQVSIVNGKVVYSANSDAIDALKQPQQAVDTITYQVQDAHGAVSTGTVSVTVKGVADAPVRNGTAGADTLNGSPLEDVLNGLGGADKLIGNAGADTLNGGLGNDTLTGGVGADRFVFTGTFGNDVVSDFQSNDVVQLDAAQFASFEAVQAASSQVGADVVITLNAANTITLQNVTLASLNSGDFLFV
ncbi:MULTISPECIES: endonuclease/exonuclease/phosphatase family protein [unclassified Phenylobacterium]|uniref:Ig-like domain-containing protein n=1 Tax=unclassified Phenylobacterium TaxID=2640670 RepID=UPI00083AC960|nr:MULTISPECIES: endonuclease/exonuclease/phosphatase family protein [unclassified Phenylobacterium]